MTYPSEGKVKFQIPGDPQIWFDGTTYYIVYYVPGVEPPIPLAYTATKEQIQAVFGPDNPIIVDLNVDDAQLQSYGTIRAGSYGEIQNTTEDPFNAWASTVEKEAQVRPWLGDPSVLAAIAEAQLEGRPITQAEFELTDWWRTHNDRQREWAYLDLSDPMTAAAARQDAVIASRRNLELSGVNNAPDELVRYMAEQLLVGNWSDTYYQNQLRAVSDPYSGVVVDPGMRRVIGATALDTTRNQEDKVRNLVSSWLGPLYGQWGQSQIASWAGRLRNDPDASMVLEEMLRKQRLAMFPEYTNPDLTYEDIASPWRNFMMNYWGEMPDELGDDFLNVVRMNDSAEAGKYLRERGLELGKKKVIDELMGAGARTNSTIVRRAV